MPTKIADLVLEELSLVNKGANKHAKVLITKRAEPVAAPISETTNVFSVEQNQPEGNMTSVTKAEARLDAIVKHFLDTQQDMGEPEAHAMLASTSPAYRKAYGEMVYARDLEIAKSTTMMTFEKRVQKVGGHTSDERATAVDAWNQLDKLAKDHAAAHGLPYHAAYMATLNTPKGRKLYAAGCTSPGAAT